MVVVYVGLGVVVVLQLLVVAFKTQFAVHVEDMVLDAVLLRAEHLAAILHIY